MLTGNNRRSTAEAAPPLLDPVFLRAQTAGDLQLEHELLDLFLQQSSTLLSTLASLGRREKADAAHLIKGSSRSIGAVALALAAQRFEETVDAQPAAALDQLLQTMSATAIAIRAHVVELESSAAACG